MTVNSTEPLTVTCHLSGCKCEQGQIRRPIENGCLRRALALRPRRWCRPAGKDVKAASELCRGMYTHKMCYSAGRDPALPKAWLPLFAGGETEREDGLLCEEDGTVTVRDSLDALLQVGGQSDACMQIIPRTQPTRPLPSLGQVLPQDIREPLVQHPCRASLLEVRHQFCL